MSDPFNHHKTKKLDFSLARNGAFVQLKVLKPKANPSSEQIHLIFKTHNHFFFGA